MVFNITSQIPAVEGLTNACVEWCKEQHYVNSFKNFQLLTSGMTMIMLSLVLFILAKKKSNNKFFGLGILTLLIGVGEIMAFIILETR